MNYARIFLQYMLASSSCFNVAYERIEGEKKYSNTRAELKMVEAFSCGHAIARFCFLPSVVLFMFSF